MAPDDVLMLNQKLDKALAIVSDTRVQVGELSVNLEAHIARDGERKEERELTCPIRPEVGQHEHDLNALGGIVRTVRSDLDVLMAWRKQEDKDDLIIAARVGPLRAFGKWFGDNATSVMLAVVIAYVLLFLDFQR